MQTNFPDFFVRRRSCRQFTDEPIAQEDVMLILRAALLSPSSRGRRMWQFVVVEERLDLEKLADAKTSGSSFIKDCRLAVAVCGNPADNDCWIEDGSIAAHAMLLEAELLGLGACWCQIHKRYISDGTSSEDIVRGILGIPEEQSVLCVIALGHKAATLPPQDEDLLKWENVHLGKW